MEESKSRELETWLLRWESEGTLPEGEEERARAVRRLLVAMDLASSAPTEEEIGRVLARLAIDGGARSLREWVGATLREVRAVIRTDLSLPSPAFRGAAAGTPTVFETPRFLITVTRRPDGLRGALLPRGTSELPAGGRVLLRAGEGRTEEMVGSTGSFRFDQVPPGDAHLEIEISGEKLLIGPVREEEG